MQQTITMTAEEVSHVATLANIPVNEEEKKSLASGFTKVLGVIDNLNKADTTHVAPTNQVTGLENITREDIVDEERQFSQDEALRNAKRTYKGFFVVDRVIEK